jgi:hypothetical protein
LQDAAEQLHELYTTLVSSSHLQKLKNYLRVKNVTGNSYFHPYHFGGLSEAAVKSMKSN